MKSDTRSIDVERQRVAALLIRDMINRGTSNAEASALVLKEVQCLREKLEAARVEPS